MQKKILVTDDAVFMRSLLKGILIPNNFTVIEACNGQEAIAQYEIHKPDLVFMDITMPVMDGVTMLTKLKENPDIKNIPVIMLTAESGRENVAYIAKLGVRDYLVKPFQDTQLIEKVKRVIKLVEKSAPVAA